MNLYFFGDSICFGQHVSPNHIWINLLTEKFEEFFLLDEVTIQNPSINGRTSRQALEDMHFQIQSNPVDYLYVQFGMNDCNHWDNNFSCPRVSKNSFEANLFEIIERATRSGIKLVFIGTNHPTLKVTNFKYQNFSLQQMNSEYNNIIRKVADFTKAILIDHESYWYTTFKDIHSHLDQLVLSDGVHLNRQGHIVYANCASPIIINALNNIRIENNNNNLIQNSVIN